MKRTTITIMGITMFASALFFGMSVSSFALPGGFCVHKISGAVLKYVNSAADCKKNELFVSNTGSGGDPGLDGLSCWDLNMDTECNPEEDINGDGACDALDCQGAACWDTDADLNCDAGEDVNDDDVCDIFDCMGPQGAKGDSGPSDDIIGGGSDKIKRDNIRYIGLYKDQSDENTEARVAQMMPIGGAVTDLNVVTTANTANAGRYYRLILRKNSADTVLKCDVATGTTECVDTDHCVEFAAGDILSLKSCPSGANATDCPGTNPATNDIVMNWTALYHAGMTCADLGFE